MLTPEMRFGTWEEMYDMNQGLSDWFATGFHATYLTWWSKMGEVPTILAIQKNNRISVLAEVDDKIPLSGFGFWSFYTSHKDAEAFDLIALYLCSSDVSDTLKVMAKVCSMNAGEIDGEDADFVCGYRLRPADARALENAYA